MRASLRIAALVSLALAARPADACAPAPRPGVRVQIAEESAVIFWDAEARREHFIRRASFQSAGDDFGFLVPTPSTPELAEVGDDLFSRLDRATEPEVVQDTSIEGVEPMTICLATFERRAPSSVPAAALAPVRVVAAQRVAGYDAVVLEADDPRALAEWLMKHGYAARPELTAWLAPYVTAKWKMTAFKIAGGAPSFSTAAVRMSFTTEQPFYPYREPADQRENLPAGAPSTRLLRVFFIGPERVEGTIGAAKGAWPGKAIWSDRLDHAPGAGAMPVAVKADAWLTMFEDRAAPRPGTDDLFFSPASDKRALKPPPVLIPARQKIPLPLDVMGFGALAVGLIIRRQRRLAQGKPRPPAA